MGSNRSVKQKKSLETGKENYAEKARRIKAISIGITLSSSILLVVLIFLKNLPCPIWMTIITDILAGFCASALAASIISWVVDVPSLVNSFKGTILESLKDNKYLEELHDEQLSLMHEQVTAIMLDKSVNLPRSFKELDKKLTSFIYKPFYNYFNESIISHESGSYNDVHAQFLSLVTDFETPVSMLREGLESSNMGPLYVFKEVETEYELVNPRNDEKEISADISIRKCLQLPDDRNVEDFFKITQFNVAIDDAAPVDIKVNVETFRKLVGARSQPEAMTYNSTLGFVLPADNTVLSGANIDSFTNDNVDSVKYLRKEHDTPSEILVKFKNIVKVHLKYKIIMPTSDNHYTRRMRYAAKQYLLQYSSADEVLIHGQVLGTLIDQKDISILQPDSKHIIINCRNWLLKGNGTFVVLDDKQH